MQSDLTGFDCIVNWLGADCFMQLNWTGQANEDFVGC